MSEAAVILKETRMNVLAVAIAFQYQSQEAFTRAFKKTFGMTPGKYRKAPVRLDMQAKMNFLDYQGKGEMNMNKPVIAELDRITIIGRAYQTNLNKERYFEEIPGFYEEKPMLPGRESSVFSLGGAAQALRRPEAGPASSCRLPGRPGTFSIAVILLRQTANRPIGWTNAHRDHAA